MIYAIAVTAIIMDSDCHQQQHHNHYLHQIVHLKARQLSFDSDHILCSKRQFIRINLGVHEQSSNLFRWCKNGRTYAALMRQQYGSKLHSLTLHPFQLYSQSGCVSERDRDRERCRASIFCATSVSPPPLIPTHLPTYSAILSSLLST